MAGSKRPSKSRTRPDRDRGGLALAEPPPKATFHVTDAPGWYANKARRISVRHVTGHKIVAVVEVVSPGNKSGRAAFDAFVRKARDLLTAGVHLLIIDPFPPTARDPNGIHPEVWGDDDADPFEFDKARPLTIVSYVAGPGPQAFIEPVAIGESLPNVPVFLTPIEYVSLPLESTYEAAFARVPERWQAFLNRKR